MPPLSSQPSGVSSMGDIARDRVHDWLTAWTNQHDAGDMTQDDVLYVFDVFAELREWLDAQPDANRGAVEDLEALRAVLSPMSAFISDGARVNRARELIAEILDRVGGR